MLRKFNSFIEKWMALVTPTCLLLGVCFPDIAKCGLPYVPAVFAFMTFAGALKSRFKDVANVFRHPGSLLIIMLLVHVVIPTASCGAGHLFFGNNMELITGMVLEFAVPTAVVSLMWVTIYDGNSPLSLSLVVLDTVLAPFLIPATLKILLGSAVTIDPARMMRELIFMVALPAVVAMVLNQITDGKVMETWPSAYPEAARTRIASATFTLCIFISRICTRLVCGVYLPKGSQYGGFHDVWNRDAQYQRRSGDRSCIFSG